MESVKCWRGGSENSIFREKIILRSIPLYKKLPGFPFLKGSKPKGRPISFASNSNHPPNAEWAKSTLFFRITTQGFIYNVLFTYRTLHSALPTQHFAQYTLTVITIFTYCRWHLSIPLLRNKYIVEFLSMVIIGSG